MSRLHTDAISRLPSGAPRPSAAAWLLIALIALSVPARLALFDWVPFPIDVIMFFSRYIEFIRQYDFSTLMAHHFTKLSSIHLYIWYPLSKLPLSPVSIIKGYAALFDYACAYWGYRMIRLRFPASSPMPLLAAALLVWTPIAPVVSSIWGQIDSTYTAFLMASVYFLMRMHSKEAQPRDRLWATICFSIAFCFKLQAVFLAPALCFLAGAALLPLRYALIPAAAFVLMQIPRLLVGYPVEKLFFAYYDQVTYPSTLSYNAANPFLVIRYMAGTSWHPIADYIGMATGPLLCLAALWLGIRYKGKKALTPVSILLVCLLSLILAPYTGTRMHERYFHAACLLSHILPFYISRLWVVPVFINTAAIISCVDRFTPLITAHLAGVTLLMTLGLLLVLAETIRHSAKTVNDGKGG